MRTVHWFGALVIALMAAAQVSASPTASYPYGIASFVESPTQPVIYGAVPSINSIVVINANTLAVTNTIPIGSNPTGLTISPDGSTLYVANSGSSFIARLNTSTLQPLTSLVSPGGSPQKLQFGNGNRLYILGGGGIHEIDATSGASAGPDLGAPEGSYPLITSGGNILISADHNWLYYGNDGLSPSNAYRFNVRTGSRWVAINSGQGLEGISLPGTSYNFQTTVDLTGFNPATASIPTGQFAVDDAINDIWINGKVINLPSGLAMGLDRLYTLPTNLAAGLFTSGVNTITFDLINAVPGTPVAFRMEASVTASVPEPTGLLLVAGFAAMFSRRSRS